MLTYGLSLACLSSSVMAIEYSMPAKDQDLIGQMQVIKAKYEDTFADYGDRYSLGYNQLVAANPGVDSWLPGEGTDVLLPTRYILPDVPRTEIVINLPEYRLYYYPRGKSDVVYTYPLGIGREGWGSPLGMTSIISKVKDPSWVPPASIRKEHAEEGDILPAVVPPGPDNPMGPYKMGLGFKGYLIHGSNQAFGVGTRTSHGCFRMLNPDVTALFAMVPMGSKVNVINQPYKIGVENGKVYLEAHKPLEGYAEPNIEQLIQAFESEHKDLKLAIDYSIVKMVISHHDGIPVQIGNTDGIPMSSGEVLNEPLDKAAQSYPTTSQQAIQ